MKARNDYYRALAGFQKTFTKNLKRKIKEVKAYKTGRMYRTTKGKIEKRKSMAVVDSTHYYPYVDEGTSRIRPRNITKKALNTHEVKSSMENVVKKYIEWQISDEISKLAQ